MDSEDDFEGEATVSEVQTQEATESEVQTQEATVSEVQTQVMEKQITYIYEKAFRLTTSSFKQFQQNSSVLIAIMTLCIRLHTHFYTLFYSNWVLVNKFYSNVIL